MSESTSPGFAFPMLQAVIAGAGLLVATTGLLVALGGVVYSGGIQAARIHELERRVTSTETRAEPVAPALSAIWERLDSIDRRLGRMEANP